MTENGWPPDTNVVTAISLSDCELAIIPGTNGQLKLWFQKGIPAIILPAIMADLSQYVESLNNSRGYTDEGSWTNGNSVRSSNHNGATAFDYNWYDHPMGIALDGWHGSDIIHGEEEPEIRRILAFYNYKGIQLVWWGNDWNSPKDSMHFQMGYNTYQNQSLCWEFINKFIRADGFSTYRRGGLGQGGAPVPQVDEAVLLGNAMANVPGVDYDVLLPHVVDALDKSQCNNENRIAMWMAQIGHESVGLKYMEEIASGAAYEGRADLGNTQPGDGVRFKGRGPIQVTGRHNYTVLSQWAFNQGMVPTSTFFVDSPEALSDLQYAFLGAIWYWTVARPDINSLCDAGDVVAVTQRINGGQNGYADRLDRWNRAKAMDLMPLLDGDEFMGVDADRLNMAVDKILGGGTQLQTWPSRSMFADSGAGIDDTVGMLLNVDGNSWNVVVIIGALLGVEGDVATVKRCAEGNFDDASYVWNDDWLAARAQEFAQKLLPLCGLLNASALNPPGGVAAVKATAKKAPAKKAAPKK